MAEGFDFAGILLPVLLSISATVILFAVTRYQKTSEGTLTGTVKIAHVELTMQGLEKRLEDRLNRMETLIRDGEDDRKESFSKVYDRLEKIESRLLLHSYRLDQMDKDSGRNSNRNNESNGD